MALTDPATQKCPALQFPLQLPSDIPATDPYSPAGHAAVQLGVVRPLLFPNRPAAQSVHTLCPPTLNFPGPHTTAVALVEPAGHACPALQLPLQDATDMADVAPNWPTAQRHGHGSRLICGTG